MIVVQELIEKLKSKEYFDEICCYAEKIPEPYRTQMINNIKRYRKKYGCVKFSISDNKILLALNSFEWIESNEGYGYWMAFWDRVL